MSALRLASVPYVNAAPLTWGFRRGPFRDLFDLTFETPAQIAGAIQNVALYGLPDDYYQHYLQNIDAVSLEDVRRVSSRYLETSKMAVVVVGDLAKIRNGIEAMKIADVVICDLDGNPLP